MAQKPETSFIERVHRQLPIMGKKGSNAARKRHGFVIYAEKMANPWRSGTADMWYSGHNDLWVEYKWLPRTPARVALDPEKLLSRLQKEWLTKRAGEGRNVRIVIGCPVGGVVLHPHVLGQKILTNQFMPLEELTKSLLALIGGSNNDGRRCQ